MDALDTSAVVVGFLLTTCLNRMLWLAANDASPAYSAVILCVLAVSKDVVKVAIPPAVVAVSIGVVAS